MINTIFYSNLRRKITFPLLLFFLIFSLANCHTKEKEKKESYFLKHVDSYQRETILKSEPQRIISLSPAITEIIFLLDSEEKLVGITDFCNYPPETKFIKKIGGLLNLNIETLVALQPDLILIGSIIGKEEIEKIEKMNIPVIAIREENRVNGVINSIQTLGKILNKDSLALATAQNIEQQLAKINFADEGEKTKPKVYYVVGFGDGGDYSAPKNSHIDEIITLAGGINIGKELVNWNISREYLFQENPDLIFIRKEDHASFIKTFPYSQLTAVKKNHVYPIESGWIDIVSPRNIEAITLIHSHIEKFESK